MNKNKKEAAHEVPVQGQQPVNINKLREKHGLKPIYEGNKDVIPTK